MHGLDRDLAMLEDTYRTAGVLDRTVFVLTADHGFITVRHRLPQQIFDAALRGAGARVVLDHYHTAAYLWIRDPSKLAAAAAQLASLQSPYIQSVYVHAEARRLSEYLRVTPASRFYVRGVEAANRYLLRSFDGQYAPVLVVFFTEGTACLPGSQGTWKGDHGGADWQSQHIPLVLSGPGVVGGRVSTYPARLIDIAPSLLFLLGIQSTGMQ
jgi:arylsulfatase A-like enzyme